MNKLRDVECKTQFLKIETHHNTTFSSRNKQSTYFQNLTQADSNIHFFKIDGNVNNLLEHTTPTTDLEYKLPFNDLMILNKSRHSTKIMSIAIGDATYMLDDIKFLDSPHEKPKELYDMVVFFLDSNKCTQLSYMFDENLVPFLPKQSRDEINPNDLPTIIERITDATIFLKNFINFINSRQLDFVVSERTEPMDKPTLPETKYFGKVNEITITDTLKKYINQYRGKNPKERDSSFWVRGHWRYLNHPCFKNLKGQMTWVHPHIKGKGELHDKDYNLKKRTK